jgi:hypothetical protein
MSTPIPLSPEEAYQASQLLGRSLFSALQLARENEARNRKANPYADDNVLRIPFPAHLMPQKAASLKDAPYQTAPSDIEPVPAEGDVAHIKRNIGKYLGSYGGTAAGAGIGTAMALRKNSRGLGAAAAGAGKGGLVGALLGTGLGSLLDQATAKSYKQKVLDSGEVKRKLVQQMYDSGELENILNSPENRYKMAEDIDPDAGVFARAFNTQQHPARLLLGGQSGFRDAKKDYYMRQRANIDKDLMHAQQEYIDLLSRIKTGSEEETPCVDAFCNGVAHMTLFGKTASYEDVDISDGSVKRLAGDMLGGLKHPFRPVADMAAQGLLNTASGTAYLTYLMRKQMRDRPDSYMEESQPTRVELQPYA